MLVSRKLPLKRSETSTDLRLLVGLKSSERAGEACREEAQISSQTDFMVLSYDPKPSLTKKVNDKVQRPFEHECTLKC